MALEGGNLEGIAFLYFQKSDTMAIQETKLYRTINSAELSKDTSISGGWKPSQWQSIRTLPAYQ